MPEGHESQDEPTGRPMMSLAFLFIFVAQDPRKKAIMRDGTTADTSLLCFMIGVLPGSKLDKKRG
jgi:hypothetical protein